MIAILLESGEYQGGGTIRQDGSPSVPVRSRIRIEKSGQGVVIVGQIANEATSLVRGFEVRVPSIRWPGDIVDVACDVDGAGSMTGIVSVLSSTHSTAGDALLAQLSTAQATDRLSLFCDEIERETRFMTSGLFKRKKVKWVQFCLTFTKFDPQAAKSNVISMRDSA